MVDFADGGGGVGQGMGAALEGCGLPFFPALRVGRFA